MLYALRSTLDFRKSIALLTFWACFSLTLFAQANICVTSSDPTCYTGCGANPFEKDGTTTHSGVVRNRYNDGGSAVLYYTGSRWQILFSGSVVDFHNDANTAPNPPGLSVGTWVSGGTCGTITAMSGGVQNTPLPIELTQFDAQNTEGSKNHLTWRTASEKDNRHFDIQRSTDGNTFHNIGQVKGNNKPSSYQFVDNQPFATSYYRLRQIDFDGTETVSKVVSVEQKGKSKSLKIYPTVVSNGILSVDTEGVQSRDFSVTNLLGQQVMNGKTPPSGVGGLDVSSLSQGTYLLKVGTEVAKFVKQ